MAQNWNLKQAYAAIVTGNKEGITDIGRRFPLTSNILARIGEDKAVGELINALPDHITVRKVESILKDGVQVDDSDNEVEETETVDVEKEDTDTSDYESMNRTQLRDLIKNAGGEKKCREEFGWAKKEQLLAYIEKYGLEEVAAEETDDDETENPYEGKTAMELFKECKKRGLKVKPKQKAAFYVEVLLKDDQEAESEEADDDWSEEEEVEEKPAKKEKKSSKKVEEPEDDDDDDDWNI